MYAKMLEQLDKYWAKLFADPLPVVTAEWGMSSVVLNAAAVHPQNVSGYLFAFSDAVADEKKSGHWSFLPVKPLLIRLICRVTVSLDLTLRIAFPDVAAQPFSGFVRVYISAT